MAMSRQGVHRPPLLVQLSRYPTPGRCKRRLAVEIGAVQAARTQLALSLHNLSLLHQLRARGHCAVVLATTGAGPRAWRRLLLRHGFDWPPSRCWDQGRGGLGTRMARLIRRGLARGHRAVLLIGSDCPCLSVSELEQALQSLGQSDGGSCPGPARRGRLVLGPAVDGGYWLIGLDRDVPQLFCGMPWGGDQVRALTCATARQTGLQLRLLRFQRDLDRRQDLGPWLAAPGQGPPLRLC